MHRLYLRKNEPGIIPAGDSGSDSSDSDSEREELDMEEDGGAEDKSKPLVTYAFYTGRFNTFDLSFAKPLVDSCATCDELKIQLAVAADETTADALRAERKLHLLEADRGYAMRKHDQELAEASRKSEPGAVPSELDHNSWDGVEFVCSDMAGVLITPKVSVNKAFYLRKMNTYCGLFSGHASQHSLCFWNETVAQKGSNEVLSSAHEFFVKRKTGTTRLNWWGDNTSSQMKNQFMMLYANELAHDDGFDFFTRIDNKYSPPGHTFMVHPTRARARPQVDPTPTTRTQHALARRRTTERLASFLARPKRPRSSARPRLGWSSPRPPSSRTTTASTC
jgi:hypothetical protein